MLRISLPLLLTFICAALPIPSASWTTPTRPSHLPCRGLVVMKGSKGLRRQDELRRKLEQCKQGKLQEQKEAEFKASASSSLDEKQSHVRAVGAHIQEMYENLERKPEV